ncbi:MAG: phytanoyl-CoA dioxygenase family protein [Nocardioidaceae bacterium]|nr:phytanoyl-CoA dioxygenase family protein [Nocardioidaceae bacterium]
MRNTFTQAEVESYRQNGFLIVEDFLDSGELERWRQVVTETVTASPQPMTGKNSEKAFTQRMHLRRRDEAARDLVDDQQIGRLVAELEGLDSVRLYLDQALVKEPYGAPTQYHLDIPWWSFDSDHACTIWVALDDATLANGCLWFLPGSHHRRLSSAVDLGPDHGALFATHPEAAAPPVAAPLPAGGCTFHNGHTIHGAGVNMTPGRRRAMTIAFMPGDATWNGTHDIQVLGEEYLQTLTVGDPIDHEGRHPRVYAG